MKGKGRGEGIYPGLGFSWTPIKRKCSHIKRTGVLVENFEKNL